jgi:hypothetical protein
MKLLFTILIFLITFKATAQDINFTLTNDQQSYNIEDIGKITFDNTIMILYLNDGSIFTIDTETIEGNNYTQSNAISDINSLQINVFPNPVQNELHVSINAQITILDLNLKTIIETNKSTIDVSGLIPGYYTVIVKVNHISKSFKLIKQ